MSSQPTTSPLVFSPLLKAASLGARREPGVAAVQTFVDEWALAKAVAPSRRQTGPAVGVTGLATDGGAPKVVTLAGVQAGEHLGQDAGGVKEDGVVGARPSRAKSTYP